MVEFNIIWKVDIDHMSKIYALSFRLLIWVRFPVEIHKIKKILIRKAGLCNMVSYLLKAFILFLFFVIFFPSLFLNN